MKVCVIANLYPPNQRGGAEVVVKRIVDGFLHSGHSVVLVTLGRKKLVEKKGSLTIYHIKPLNVFSFLDINQMPVWLRIFWHPLDVLNFSGAHQVKKILKKEKPDLVMTHNLKGLSFLIPRAIKKLGLKHIHTLHDVQLSRPSGLILFGQEKPFLVLDKIYEKICRYLFASPAVIISPSRWLLDYYIKRGFFPDSKRAVLPNPVILKKVDKSKKNEVSEILSLLYVGQLVSSKGVDFLINALKHFNQVDWQLKIVGDGSIKADLEKMVGQDQRFKFLGKLPAYKLPAIYRQADFTVVPSLCYENSPTVIFESLAANTPVIASDIGGIGEIVKDDFNGFTFAPGNEKNLLEVLQHFATHKERLVDLKKNCFVSIRELSLSHYLKKVFTFLDT
ncbi:MAG: glycosyltransferase family 4 protein [Candidatus Buchananbacteria bacterium]|nr:glycosyltransferase family 4 protein [Candidatus Buchananbacteria bacterium]